ncbi:1-phosphofructokinase family hexose kinase [Reyranella sp.]|uniref:1-phosphofructokinase family hexose kinase n=1 Tax=Reyranella sp. TaxID=1929291 RepID=UPI003784DBF9
MSARIVTLTVNPAVDLAAQAEAVQPGHKIRTFDERYDPGGGGINVARVICELGGETLALFASGGVTGRFVEQMLTQAKVPWQAVLIGGTCRISVTVHDRSSGQEYRFVPQGPRISPAEAADILETLRHVEAAWIVASGSLASGMSADFYAKVADIAAARGARFALDTSGLPLTTSLGHKVSLLKPSLSEFEAILGRKVPDLESQMDQAKRLVQSGAADMIALTLGSAGAILATANHVCHMPAPAVTARTGVGAGDSFLAGLVLALARGQSHESALRLAVACGAAAVQGSGTAQVRRADVATLLA